MKSFEDQAQAHHPNNCGYFKPNKIEPKRHINCKFYLTSSSSKLVLVTLVGDKSCRVQMISCPNDHLSHTLILQKSEIISLTTCPT